MLAPSRYLRARLVSERARRSSRRKFRAEDLCRRGKRLATQQLAFIADPARWKVACCSRRAGKTVACAIILLMAALGHAETTNLYLTLSRVSGKRIVWRQLLALNREYALGGQINRAELTITFPNGSVILVAGAKDEAEIEKLRGPKYFTVVLDEAQSFKEYIQQLVDDVIMPALMDTKGYLVMIGTPGPVRQGYFYEAVRNAAGPLLERMNVAANDNAEPDEDSAQQLSWSVHHWTVADNPFIDDVEDELAGIRRRKAWTADNPTYQREYLGRWVTEHDALVYKYDQERNGYVDLPDRSGLHWHCVLMVDQGFHDADAGAALWFRKGKPGVWLEELFHERKQSAGQLVALVKEHWERLKGRCIRVGWDEGGGGKKVAEDARLQGIPVEPADKVGKIAGVELTNTALVSGCLKVAVNGHAAADAGRVTWDPKARGVKFSERYHTDIWDCANYGLRWLVGIVPLNEPAEDDPVVNEVEAWALERQEAAKRRIKTNADRKNWVKRALGGR